MNDEEWALVAPYPTLMTEDAPPRVHDLREVFNGLRWIVRAGAPWHPSATILDSRTLQSSSESGQRAGCDGARRKRGSKVHMTIDTLGHLLTSLVTPANEQDRDQAQQLAQHIQQITGQSG